ncbi:hypothetical protein ACIRQQ_43455 [Streptomyces fuscichromogenes]|uniref:hypothetical protein n=1 Tax=Streptomyces fuscichromogenes TaxID=1324013 RepID=UPI0037FB8B71
MDAELAALAASGAAAVVQSMAQDAWTTVRERLSGLFGRAAADGTDSVRAALDETRIIVAASGGRDDDPRLVALTSDWRERLLVLLQQEPALAEELRALVAHATDQRGAVHNVITGGEVRGPVIQAHTITGDLHFG